MPLTSLISPSVTLLFSNVNTDFAIFCSQAVHLRVRSLMCAIKSSICRSFTGVLAIPIIIVDTLDKGSCAPRSTASSIISLSLSACSTAAEMCRQLFYCRYLIQSLFPLARNRFLNSCIECIKSTQAITVLLQLFNCIENQDAHFRSSAFCKK